MPFNRHLLFAITFLFFVSFPASGRTFSVGDSLVYRAAAERQFVQAMKYFTARQYSEAVKSFLDILKDYPHNHRSTGAYIMAAKSYYRLGNYRESIRLLRNFVDLYPESEYVDDALYILGLDDFRLQRYEDAAEEFVAACDATRDAKLLERSEAMLDMLAQSNLPLGKLQLLQSDARRDEVKALIGVRLAEKLFQQGDARTARELLRSLATVPVKNRYAQATAALLEKIEKGGMTKIGAVLPLMLKSDQPAVREIGAQLLEGMQYAVDEYNLTTLPKVYIEIRDSERDPSVAARIVSELCSDEKIAAIVGPAYSNEAFASVGIANARGVPIISPTATANGIAAIGPYVFQGNPDFEVRGRAVAQYALEKLGARQFAVLAPSELSKQVVDAFLDEVAKGGGEIVDVQWYKPGETDLRVQLTTMRQRAMEKAEPVLIDFSSRKGGLKNEDFIKMLQWGVPQRIIDSLTERESSVPINFLFGENGKQIADSLGLPTLRVHVKTDSLSNPVRNIDALFLPIASAEEIGIVGSQLRYFNFQTQLLGTGEWYDLGELDRSRDYINGVVFSTDSYWNEKSKDYQLFAGKFERALKKKPSKNTLYGYDAMRIVLEAIKNGALYRNDIAAALVKLQNFSGVHSRISFGQRVNTVVTLLQFNRRVVKKLGEIDIMNRTFFAAEP